MALYSADELEALTKQQKETSPATLYSSQELEALMQKPSVPQQPQQQSFGQEALQFGKNVLGGLYAGAVEPLIEVQQMAAPFRLALAPAIPSAVLLKPFQIPADIPVGQKGSVGYEIGKWGPLVAQLGLGGVGALRALGPLVERTPILSQLLKKAVPRAEEAANSYAKKMLSDYYDTPNFDQRIGEEGSIIRGVLNKNANIHKKNVKTAYGKISPEEWATQIEKPDVLKYIKDIKKAGSTDLDSVTVDKLNQFKNNPTAWNAHVLQNALGKNLGKIYQRDFAGQPIQAKINDIKNLRQDLRDKIGELVGPKYQQASDLYKNTLLPYEEDKAIYGVLKGHITSPESIARRLSQGETVTGEEPFTTKALQTITKHLSSEDKEKMILPFIKGTPGNPVSTTSGEFNYEPIVKGLESLKTRGLDKFMSPQMRDDLSILKKLQSNVERQQRLTKYVRRGAGAVGLGEIYHKIRGE